MLERSLQLFLLAAKDVDIGPSQQSSGTLFDRETHVSIHLRLRTRRFPDATQQVFDRVRAGEEQFHAIAEGCLSLLRELIRCSTSAATLTSAPSSGRSGGGRRSRKGCRGGGGGGGGGGSAAASGRLDASGRLSLLAGLRGVFPLLMETDSHSLVQVKLVLLSRRAGRPSVRRKWVVERGRFWGGSKLFWLAEQMDAFCLKR